MKKQLVSMLALALCALNLAAEEKPAAPTTAVPHVIAPPQLVTVPPQRVPEFGWNDTKICVLVRHAESGQEFMLVMDKGEQKTAPVVIPVPFTDKQLKNLSAQVKALTAPRESGTD